MKLLRSTFLALAALIFTAATAQADEYGAGYYAANGNATPPANLKIAPGLSKMQAVVGQVVAMKNSSREVTVRDAQNRDHKFTIPAHQDLAKVTGKVRVSFAAGRAVQIVQAS